MIRYAILLLLVSQLEFAQPVNGISKNAQISLLTIYPGSELYSTFGHTAIRIVDSLSHLDRIYNYGTFSFKEPGFYVKFIRGKLDYMLSAYDYKYAYQMYSSERRPIIAQQLNLTPEMKNALYRFLEWNYLPQNRRYRYDFFFDNCATRIRDVFENVLGKNLQLYYNPHRKLTFRNYIDFYLENHSFSDYGIDLALGAKADRIALAREALFLPDYLYEALDKAVININGEAKPLVTRVDTLLWIEGADIPVSVWQLADILLWSLLLLTALVTCLSLRSAVSSPLKLWLDFPLFALAGLIGCLILFLWFGTDHKITPDNWNIAWAWPTHLIVGAALFIKKKPKWINWYLATNGILMLLLLFGWALVPQSLHIATIPLVLSITIRSLWLAYSLR